MNEATFEANIPEELRRLFPAITPADLTHQDTFTIRLGHRVFTVKQEKRDKATGRLDILVNFKGMPLAVLELKAPDSPLTDNDRDQGISYARLTEPTMAPLVIISNGTKTKFFNTYDKKPWKPDNRNEKALENIFNHALECAAADRDEAVRFLITGDTETWTEVVRSHTTEALAQLEGELANLGRSLARGLTLDRKILPVISTALSENEPAVILTGPPLSGKTNVLAQFCRTCDSDKFLPFYVDVAATSQGIFRQMADTFTNQLFLETTPEKVMQWLNISLRTREDSRRLVVLIDGFSAASSALIKADVDQLLAMSNRGQFSMLLAMHDAAYDVLQKVNGRPNDTLIGQAKRYAMSFLDNDEFAKASEDIQNNFHITFQSGSKYNLSYRVPQILRSIAGAFNQPPADNPAQNDAAVQVPVVSSVMGLSHLGGTWQMIRADAELQNDLRCMADAVISDESDRERSPSLRLAALGQGLIRLSTAEEVLGVERLARLRAQGYARLTTGPDDQTLLSPTVPLLLSAAASHVVAEKIIETVGQNEDAAYEQFLTHIAPFPFSDVVGAAAIYKLAHNSPAVFNTFMQRLLGDEPEIGILDENHQFAATFPGVGEIEFELPPGSQEKTINNIMPWLILSQLAAQPLSDDSNKRKSHLMLLAHIGAFPNVLRAPDIVALEDMVAVPIHDIPGHGSIVCREIGIIEPITIAMQACFNNMPSKMESLCTHAATKGILPLASRLATAANSLRSCADLKARQAATRSANMLQIAISQMLKEASHTPSQKQSAAKSAPKKKMRKMSKAERNRYREKKKRDRIRNRRAQRQANQ
ncbi:MAG: hypothetical protein HN350_12485 [Phycisphaerales bacterium]|nr:hypothetical protein [Phycisphaerales bacterium]